MGRAVISTRERRTRPVWRVVTFRRVANLPDARIVRLAWTSWVLALALTAVSLLLFVLNLSHPGVHVFDYWAETTVIALANSTVGALVASRRPKNPIGWIFCVWASSQEHATSAPSTRSTRF